MRPLRQHTGLAVALERENVDTDQIIPKQFLKRIERTGFGKYLFYDWAHRADGERDPGFVLNEPRYKDASILIAGRNFGCGSSREHAAWALLEYGFRVIIAPSFADIFVSNCYQNGMAPVVLSSELTSELARRCRAPERYHLTVDLKQQRLWDEHGFSTVFQMDDFRRQCLIEGLDDIGLTLQHEGNIAEFEKARR
ncbi:MAG TPA: 3-isopropylmalate dehydratase small subunit [Terriglobales bacterium]|nr:3-isopropylmalate dehydratase small subunit [Terriglobales bacterium]